jgi:hypothetical protein
VKAGAPVYLSIHGAVHPVVSLVVPQLAEREASKRRRHGPRPRLQRLKARQSAFSRGTHSRG